jgi:tRNA pseudouridine38-40 synthase
LTLFDASFDEERVEPSAAPRKGAPTSPIKGSRTVRIGLGIAYDGTDFHGFAQQPSERSVAGVLMAALRELLGEVESCVCAGRTDAGVHAARQVIHVDCDAATLRRRFVHKECCEGTEIESLAQALCAMLAPEVACFRAVVMPDSFDARRSAITRRYRYDVDASPHPDPLRRRDSWQVRVPLDLAAMRIGTDALLGEHDFSAFCRRPDDQKTGPLLRRVLRADWCVLDEGIYRLEIEAQAFCHQMVRSIVGALVAVGEGRMVSSEVFAILKSADRSLAPALAPPQGLCLIDVSYPEIFAKLLA